MTNYKTLLKKDIWTLKNHILEIKRNPKRAILYIFYIIWIGSVVFGGLSATKNQEMTQFKSTLGPQIIGGVFIALIIMLFAFNLYRGMKESSTFFNMGDVHFLFPSPISSKKILLYNMIKSTILYMLLYIFIMWAFIPTIVNFVNVNISYMPFMYFGFMSAVILVEPMKFLIFSLGTRYKIKPLLEKAIIFLISTFVLYVIIGIINNGNFIDGLLQSLNASWIKYIPLIGWSRTVFMAPIDGVTSYTTVALVLETLLILSCIYLAYKMADDYYEDVIGATEKKTSKKKKQKSGKSQIPKILVRKDKNLKVGGPRKGAMALLWKSKVEYKRTDLHTYFSFMTIIFLVLGIVGGMIASKYGAGLEVMFIANGGLAYLLFLFSVATVSDNELSKPYIYLIPGSTSKKMISAHLLDVIRTTIDATVLNLALGITMDAPWVNIIVLSIFIASFYVLNLSCNFLVRVIFPNKFDRKVLSLLFLLIQMIFIILPGAIVGGISVAIFHGPLAFFTGVVIVNLIEIIVLLAFSNLIFKNVEWV